METYQKSYYGIIFMYIIIFATMIFITFSCNTVVKDEPEIEKVLEDGTKELIEDAIKLEAA